MNDPAKFSAPELQSLSELISSEPLYGVSFSPQDPTGETEDTGSEIEACFSICQALADKDILDADLRLTRHGIHLIETLRSYKLAQEYILLNEMRISKNKDKSITLITINPDETYSFFRTKPQDFLEALAVQIPWLKIQDPYPASNLRTIKEDNWIEELIDNSMAGHAPENMLIILSQWRVDIAKPLARFIYYRQNGGSHVYNQETQQHKQIPSQEIRKQIQEILTVDKSEC